LLAGGELFAGRGRKEVAVGMPNEGSFAVEEDGRIHSADIFEVAILRGKTDASAAERGAEIVG